MDSRGAAPLRTGRSAFARRVIRSLARSLTSSLTRRRARDCNRIVVLQLVEAAGGDDVSRIDAVDLGQPAVGHSRRYAAQMRDIALNYIHERCLTILLDGGGWNQRYSLQRIH